MKPTSLILFLFLSYWSVGQSDSIQYPYLEVCADKAINSCTAHRLYLYFSSQLKYPKLAKTNKTQGVVTVSFIITQDGKIIQLILNSDIGNGCGEEALRLFEHLKSSKIKWKAGKENGRAVCYKVSNYPIYFDLETTQREAPSLQLSVNPQRIIRSIPINGKKKESESEIIAEKEAKPIQNKKILRKEEDLRIYDVVHKSPIFPGCKNGGIYNDTLRADDCSIYFLQRYLDLRQYIKYPEIAFENGIEGIVTVSYIVEKDGSMSNIYCTQDIGGDCGRMLIRAFELMKASQFKWYPAIYKGKPVRVNRTFQYQFSLTEERARRASKGF